MGMRGEFQKIEDNHIVKIFGIQGSWAGGSGCCEMTIHFDFIPDLAGDLNLFKELQNYF